MFRDSIAEPELVVPSGDIRAARRRIEAAGRRYHLPVSKPLEIVPPKPAMVFKFPKANSIFISEPEFPTLDKILRWVCSIFGASINEMKSIRRPRWLSFARQCFCYLAVKHTSKSLPEIGRFLGGRDHTTVLHAYRQFPIHKCRARENPEKWMKPEIIARANPEKWGRA